MNSKVIMIEEATKAKAGLVAEMQAAFAVGTPDAQWLADRAESLAYYNRLLVKLGAGPA